MKAQATQAEEQFIPVTLTITLESENDLLAWAALAGSSVVENAFMEFGTEGLDAAILEEFTHYNSGDIKRFETALKKAK